MAWSTKDAKYTKTLRLPLALSLVDSWSTDYTDYTDGRFAASLADARGVVSHRFHRLHRRLRFACPIFSNTNDTNITDGRFAFHSLTLVGLCLTDFTDYTDGYADACLFLEPQINRINADGHASLALSSRTRMTLISLMGASLFTRLRS